MHTEDDSLRKHKSFRAIIITVPKLVLSVVVLPHLSSMLLLLPGGLADLCQAHNYATLSIVLANPMNVNQQCIRYGSWAVCFTYGVDGGPAANLLGPKYADFTKHVTTYTGLHLPDVEIKHLVLANIALKGVGVFLFIFGSSLGAFLLLLHLAFITPILYDFYNYDLDNPQFGPLFIKFTENVALFGALIFFIEMKKLNRTRHPKKRISKAKAQ